MSRRYKIQSYEAKQEITDLWLLDQFVNDILKKSVLKYTSLSFRLDDSGKQKDQWVFYF